MKSTSIIRLAQLLVITLMISVSFFAFSQTTIYSQLVGGGALALKLLLGGSGNYPLTFQVILFTVIFFPALISGMLLKRVGSLIVCAIAFVLFWPATDLYSSIGVIKLLGAVAFINPPPIYFSVLGATTLLFCYITLVCLLRTQETNTELTKRGGQTLEIQLVVEKQIIVTLSILGVATLLTLGAAAILILGQSAMAGLVANFTGVLLVLGVASIVTVSAALYYLFKKSQ